MKILWLSHTSGEFGAERAMAEGIAGLKAAGHEITVALPMRRGVGLIWKQLEVPLVGVVWAWWIGKNRSLGTRVSALLRTVISVAQLFVVLKRGAFDLVVTNTISTPSAALAARLRRIPHVWYLHEFGERDHSLSFLFGEKRSLQMIDQLSTLVAVNSSAVEQHYRRRISPEKIRLLYYAVHVSPPDDQIAPVESLRLVIVGQIQPGKGQEDAIHAVAILARQSIEVQLDIIGPAVGHYYERLVALAGELGVSDRVHFRGRSDIPAAWFSAADIALVCSRDEAFGRVTVEAMKSGTAVVGARSGGTPELIEEGTTGLLYTPGDSGELADRIAHLDRDRALLQRMSEAAQTQATERFTIEKFSGELQAIFEEAVSRGPA